MDVVHPYCCGLDIHKKLIVACSITPGTDGQPHKQLRSFGTMSDDLQQLATWLAEQGVSHVAMESTGSFWKPIFNMLEDHFELLLVNAQHLKAVPGRKTDVKDAEWIADLLRHGLLKPSFVPERAQRELRELVRYRTSVIQERATAANRLQKVLEGANIKLASVASDVLGRSSREMLEALLAGQTDTAAMAELARGQLRTKRALLERALAGNFAPHQRFLVAEILAHIDFLDQTLERLNDEVAARERPFEEQLAEVDSIPGVGRRTAEIVLAEVGPDVRRFVTAGHLASWAGVCPGQDESAGKHRSGKTRKGNRWLRAALVEAAHSAIRTKTYLGAQFRRLASRRGPKKAIVAVAHSILTIIYHLLLDGHAYDDLGDSYFDQRHQQHVTHRLTQRLERLGYHVTLEPITSAA
ncbi:MAG TPA: IS110 family transposase [Chloroflexota bacterium]